MTSLQKVIVTAATCCIVLFGATVLVAAWGISRYGVVSVHVEDRHNSFTIPVPAALGHWALSAARGCGGLNFHTDSRFVSARTVRDFLATVGRELEEAPDGVYLEVESRDGWVRITKEGRTLRLRVRDDYGGAVDVRVPAALARRSVEAIRVRG